MELLGKTLETLFNSCKRKFSLKTVLLLLDQMVSAIEALHLKNYIHRDVKPENFLMGIGKQSDFLFMIDFGLSKSFRDPKTARHILKKTHQSFTGTARYASINANLCIEQSRRDDLESLGYIFVYFLKGSLPWMNIKAKDKTDKYEKITQAKVITPISLLCKELPTEFEKYISYCRCMQFSQRPDYAYIRKLFKELGNKLGFAYDFCYDWTPQTILLKPLSQTNISHINKKQAYEPKPELITITQKLQTPTPAETPQSSSLIQEKGSTEATLKKQEEDEKVLS